MRRVLAFVAFLTAVGVAHAQSADELAFRDLYKELVETNTTRSSGSCTRAAKRMAARLRDAGFPKRDIYLIPAPDDGSLVAIYPGRDDDKRAILLLAHLDVVEAKRSDWTRDPFKLVEENGYFYARGAADDKAQAAIWVDTFIRLRAERFQPRRTLKLVLTCGEETSEAFNGARYLATQQRDLIDAEFALNEGAGGRLDERGKPVVLNIQIGEKLTQNFELEVRNAGGHSSRPVKENAIYRLADALIKLRGYDFPFETNEITRGYFRAIAGPTGGAVGAAMKRIASDPADVAAAEIVAAASPTWNGLLRTTCVATTLEAGHARNALPQRATAVVNCRIFPGTSVSQVRERLVKVIGDSKVSVKALRARNEPVVPPPLNEAVLGPAREVAAEVFPGVPFVPLMGVGATDGAFMTPAGIPTYGLTGIFTDPDGNGVHGLNERIRVKSLMDARRFLYKLVKRYSK
jgi:acetylornithine deacetylase/succinyl-diaminopimelate desuccinylase-like protein